MGAHPRGAVQDGALQHAGAPGIDILDGEIALHGGDRRMASATLPWSMPAAAEQAGLVEVDVGVDKAGQDEPAVDVDFGASHARRGSIAAIRPPATPISTGVAKAGVRVAEDQVEGGFGGHRGGQASEGAGQGQLPIVCRLRHGLFKICACNLSAGL